MIDIWCFLYIPFSHFVFRFCLFFVLLLLPLFYHALIQKHPFISKFPSFNASFDLGNVWLDGKHFPEKYEYLNFLKILVFSWAKWFKGDYGVSELVMVVLMGWTSSYSSLAIKTYLVCLSYYAYKSRKCSKHDVFKRWPLRTILSTFMVLDAQCLNSLSLFMYTSYCKSACQACR